MIRRIVSLGCLLALSVWLPPPPARAACTVEEAAKVPVTVAGNTLLISVQVNGIAANFVLDTGAQRSMVTDAAARRLGLARDQWVGTTMRGLGGIERRANADPRSLTLGGVKLVRPILSHDTSLTVGTLPHNVVSDVVVDGLLGRDFLAAFDLDLDVPERTLTLYRVHDCAGRFLPWHGDYTSVPVTEPAFQAMVVPVQVNGVPMAALLDSGATATLIAAPGMYKLHLQPEALAGDPVDRVAGLGPHTLAMHRHTFRVLQVGHETIENPVIWVEPVRLTPIVDMLLGEDWLAEHRVWVSFATRQLFVAGPQG